MSKAQFQQMKSTEAVHIRLPHGIWFNKGASTMFSQYRPIVITDHKRGQFSMYSSVGDKEQS